MTDPRSPPCCGGRPRGKGGLSRLPSVSITRTQANVAAAFATTLDFSPLGVDGVRTK